MPRDSLSALCEPLKDMRCNACRRRWFLCTVTLGVAVLLGSGPSPAPAQPEEVMLTPSDASSGLGGGFGASVAIDEDYLVIGAPRDDQVFLEAGAAYVFRREDSSWVEKAKLLPSVDTGANLFGESASISGDLILVGAPVDWWMWTRPGEAYMFGRDGESWVEEAHLRAPVPADADGFGSSVSVAGELAAVGAPASYGDGVTYIYRRHDGTYPCATSTDCVAVGLATCTGGACEGVTWAWEATLISSTGDRIGWPVSIRGDRVVLGSHAASVGELEYAGTAYVFRRDGETWTEEARLTASDAREGDYFGSAVGIDGDYIVIGAKDCDDAYPANPRFDSGAAYVFRRGDNGTPIDPTDDFWIEQSKLTPSDGVWQGHFGQFASISGDYLGIGATLPSLPSGAYVFRRAGTSWIQVCTLRYFPVAATCRFAAAGQFAYDFTRDCNENGLSDGCEAPGDVDGDNDADMFDFARAHDCLTGPTGGALGPACCFFDFELDGDVDLRDLRLFQLAFTGS